MTAKSCTNKESYLSAIGTNWCEIYSFTWKNKAPIWYKICLCSSGVSTLKTELHEWRLWSQYEKDNLPAGYICSPRWSLNGNPVVALGFATLDFSVNYVRSCCGGTKYLSSSEEELIIQRPRKKARSASYLSVAELMDIFPEEWYWVCIKYVLFRGDVLNASSSGVENVPMLTAENLGFAVKLTGSRLRSATMRL